MPRVSGDSDGSPGARQDQAAAVAFYQVALPVELEDRDGGEGVGEGARVGQLKGQSDRRVLAVNGQAGDRDFLDVQGGPLGAFPAVSRAVTVSSTGPGARAAGGAAPVTSSWCWPPAARSGGSPR